MIANFKNVPMIVKFYHSQPTGPKNSIGYPEYRVCTCYIRMGNEVPSTFRAKIHKLNRVMPYGKSDLLGVGGYVSYPTREGYDKSFTRRMALDDALVDFVNTLEGAGIEVTPKDLDDFINDLSKSVGLYM